MKLKLILCLAVLSTLAFGQAAITVTNAGTTGTTANSLAKINASNNAVITGTSDTAVPAYITVGGAGTTGLAVLAVAGQANCTMDSTIASNAGGDYVIASTTVGGDCHAQSAAPSSGTWIVGYLASSSTASGSTAAVTVNSGFYGGGGGTTTNALTMNNSGTGAASGSTFNGSAAVTMSTNTIGAMPIVGPSRIWRMATSDDQGGSIAIGNFRPAFICVGGTQTTVASTASNPPMTAMNTGATSTNFCDITQNDTIGWFGKQSVFITEGNLSATTLERFFAGMTNSMPDVLNGDAPTADKYAGFRYSTNASDTNFMCMVSGGTAPTGVNGGLVSSGVAADTAKHVFEIDEAASIASFTFKIDGTTVCTISSNLPAAGQYAAGVGIETLTTASKTFNWASTYQEENH